MIYSLRLYLAPLRSVTLNDGENSLLPFHIFPPGISRSLHFSFFLSKGIERTHPATLGTPPGEGISGQPSQSSISTYSPPGRGGGASRRGGFVCSHQLRQGKGSWVSKNFC